MTARRRIEVASFGVDETKQLVGTSPFGGSSWLGLRVPTKSTASLTPAGQPQKSFRYLFMGCAFSIGAGSRAHIIGYRQWQSIGCKLVEEGLVRPLTFPVTTPGWTFPDATVTWHWRRLGPPNAGGLPIFRPSNLTDGQSFRQGFSMTPALLYQTITLPAGDPYYVDLTAYTPPNGGRPYGTPLSDGPELGTVYGLQTDWKSPYAWRSLDLEVRGPETVACFISVAQTNPSAYPQLPPSSGALLPGGIYGSGLSPEDLFTVDAQLFDLRALQWSVGAAMTVEIDSLKSDVRAAVGGERWSG